MRVFKRLMLPIFWVGFIAFATMNPTFFCSTNLDSEDATTEEADTPVGKCRNACDVLYDCGISVVDDETGNAISLPECRAGCESDPGNVECVDNCVDSYEVNDHCDELADCVGQICAIPVY